MSFLRLIILALAGGGAAAAAEWNDSVVTPLPKLRTLAYPPQAPEWEKQIPQGQWPDINRLAAMIPEWPDLTAPCHLDFSVRLMGVEENTLRFQQADSGVFSISAGPPGKQSFRFRAFAGGVPADFDKSCRVDLCYYCVGVYQKEDHSLVRVLLPLRGEEAVIRIASVEFKNGPEKTLPNRKDLIQPLHNLTLPENVRLMPPDAKWKELLPATALRSLSLRCRVIPHSSLEPDPPAATGLTSVWRLHPWHTVELASWNAEKTRRWTGTGSTIISCDSNNILTKTTGLIRDHFSTVWSREWKERWHHALTTLPKAKLARVPAGLDGAGQQLIAEDLNKLFETEAKRMAPHVIRDVFVMTSAGAQESRPGVLDKIKLSVDVVSFNHPKPKEVYQWSIRPAAVYSNAVKLLSKCPDDVRRAVLYKLDLEESGGVLKDTIAPPVLSTAMAGNLTGEISGRAGFLTHPQGRNYAPDDTGSASGCITVFAAGDLLLRFELTTTWTNRKGIAQKTTVGLYAVTHGNTVAAPMERERY